MADTIEAFLSRLHHPVLAGIDLSLDRMHRLLGILGSPQKRLPPVIHVAGTNGKGSLIAYLQAIFEAGGYTVHRYISPHLVHFNERIVLQGREIESGALEIVLKHIASRLQSYPATFFEATTAAAFLAFSEKPADILLLETGMGGRLDATNVIDKPLLTAITPIALDHCEYLGNSIAAIAGEKAGILKRGIGCVVGKQSDEAAGVIAKAAEKMASPLYRYGREWQVRDGMYQSEKRSMALHPALPGEHQFDNAGAAVACIDQLPQFTIGEAQIAQGLTNAVWPARLQKLTQGRYAVLMPDGMELWLDGGHNPQGAEVLAKWFEQQHKEIHLVCGMVKDKDAAGFLRILTPYVTSLQAVAIPGEQLSKPAELVAQAAKKVGMAAEVSPSLQNALQTIVQRAKTPSIICICGSLYLAGKVLATN